jgi:hypothetical protein
MEPLGTPLRDKNNNDQSHNPPGVERTGCFSAEQAFSQSIGTSE